MARRLMEAAAVKWRRNEDQGRWRQNHSETGDVTIGARNASEVGELRNRHYAERRLAGDSSRGIGRRHRGSGGEHECGKLGFHEAPPRKANRPIAADKGTDGHGELLWLTLNGSSARTSVSGWRQLEPDNRARSWRPDDGEKARSTEWSSLEMLWRHPMHGIAALRHPDAPATLQYSTLGSEADNWLCAVTL